MTNVQYVDRGKSLPITVLCCACFSTGGTNLLLYVCECGLTVTDNVRSSNLKVLNLSLQMICLSMILQTQNHQ